MMRVNLDLSQSHENLPEDNIQARKLSSRPIRSAGGQLQKPETRWAVALEQGKDSVLQKERKEQILIYLQPDSAAAALQNRTIVQID